MAIIGGGANTIGSMMTTTAAWQCKCGLKIMVIGEMDRNNPSETTIAECPSCGDRQVIYAHRIVCVNVKRRQRREQSEASSDAP